MNRCCSGAIADEFEPCYASVLVAPSGLRQAVEDLERGPINPCITSWCTRCRKCSLLTGALDEFLYPSAHHAHALVLSRVLGAALK